MKIFRRRKVQLEKWPKSRVFFFRRLKNLRAEELWGETWSFGTEIFRRFFCEINVRPENDRICENVTKKFDKNAPDENFQEEKSATWKMPTV